MDHENFQPAPPRLWISEEGIHRRRKEIEDSPLASALEAWKQTGDEWLEALPEADGQHLQALGEAVHLWAVLYLATGEKPYAEAAVSGAIDFNNKRVNIDTACLGRAAVAILCAIALDTCGAAASPQKTRELAKITAERARGFATISDGNPDNPFNNWWGVTHSAEGMAALAALPYDSSLQCVFAGALEKVRFYISHYGDHGHCYEGTGYGQYAFSSWGAFVLAARHAAGIDLLEGYAGIPRMAALIAAMTVPLPHRADSAGEEAAPWLGRRIFWNDDGGNGGFTGIGMMHFPLADPRYRAALRGFCEQMHGPEGDGVYLQPHANLLWTYLYYPVAVAPAAPREALPLSPVDFRTGLAVFRNRYLDANDCVFGAYAKNWHGGGHAHDDAGSFRLIGLGGEWAQNGGQAKFGPENQCAIMVDGRQRPDDYPTVPGKISYHAANPQGGGVVSLRLDKTCDVSRLDRHFAVDYSGAAGCDAVVALYDRLWDSRERAWSWTLCLGPGASFEEVAGGNGFILRSEGTDAYLRATFIQPRPVRLELVEGPPSERTFSNGTHRVYPGVTHIRTTVRAERTEFFVILTLQRGEAPAWTPSERNGVSAAVSGEVEIALDMSRWHEGPLRSKPNTRLET